MKKYEGKVANHIVRSIIKIDNKTGEIGTVSQVFEFDAEANRYWCDLIDEIDMNSLFDTYDRNNESLKDYSYDINEAGDSIYYPFTVKSTILGVNVTFRMLESEMVLPTDVYFEK